MVSLKSEVKALESEVQVLTKTYEDLAAKVQADQESEDLNIPSFSQDVSQHDYFDELINGRVIESLSASEPAQKKRKPSEDFKSLKDKYIDSIRLENCYRLGGITAFPVNDHGEDSDEFLGLRFDVYDKWQHIFVTPHYVILKRDPKNQQWVAFKTTVPKFIPVDSLSTRYANTDLHRFATEIRSQLIELQRRKAEFASLENRIQGQLDADLSYSKIVVRLNGYRIILICGPDSIASVIVTGKIDPLLKRKLELGLKDAPIEGSADNFVELIQGI